MIKDKKFEILISVLAGLFFIVIGAITCEYMATIGTIIIFVGSAFVVLGIVLSMKDEDNKNDKH